MPKRMFLRLDEDKRARIRNAALKEFAQNTYQESSTNRIVETAGIAKGSLFKYFDNKMELYFYVLDTVIQNLLESLNNERMSLKGDMFSRVLQYASFEFSWYMRNPDEYMVLRRAQEKENTEIYNTLQQRYTLEGNAVFNRLFEDMGEDQFQGEKEKRLDILRWCLLGFNDSFFHETHTGDNVRELKDAYLAQLTRYLEILKNGLW